MDDLDAAERAALRVCCTHERIPPTAVLVASCSYEHDVEPRACLYASPEYLAPELRAVLAESPPVDGVLVVIIGGEGVRVVGFPRFSSRGGTA